jgi:hypothetical protein
MTRVVLELELYLTAKGLGSIDILQLSVLMIHITLNCALLILEHINLVEKIT